MSTHHAFLRAICEEPDELAHRLVYADWLDDQGDHERAEFIRVQCQLAHFHCLDPDAEPMRVRAAHLLETNRACWQEPVLVGLDPPCSFDWTTAFTFTRGFIEHARLLAPAFLRQADWLFRRTPLRELQVSSLGWEDFVPLPQLLDSHFIRRLRGLDLSMLRVNEVDLYTLANSPQLQNLTSVQLGQQPTVAYPGRLSVAAIRALAQSSHLSKLTLLDLSGHRLGLGSIEALGSSKHWVHLRELNLERNRVRDQGLQVLLYSPCFRELEILRLGNNQITAQSMETLILSPIAQQLIFLELGNSPGQARPNQLGDAGLVTLARGPLRKLRMLLLARNEIGDVGMEVLARSHFAGSIRLLDLQGNHLRTGSLWALAAGAIRQHVVELNLSHNHIADRAAEVFLELDWPNLRRLHLQGNPIGERCWRQLQACWGNRLLGEPA